MEMLKRTEPNIPDHEVLRKIGGGAYGEVWMARGVTGAYRAIKIVRREDFDDERGFEREFEGILKFEPISRDHPGLVNVLHVGRSRDDAFYYYVMELGDDIREGREINPVEYEARTLSSDIKAAAGKAQALNPCLDVGIRLAEALAHLHALGLSHRDVKPANIIFVNGKAKLADIGLVAASGQRTFVGTEGFVPPEGPGSAQADVYSLGKVIYEISTGKDRLQFPEVPEELHPDTNPKQWQSLNQVVCDICNPRMSGRTISTAAQLVEALKKIREGKRVKMSKGGWLNSFLWLTLFGLCGVALYLGWMSMFSVKVGDNVISPKIVSKERGGNQTAQNPDKPSEKEIVEVETCIVSFVIEPSSGVEAYSLTDTYIGEISVMEGEYEVGELVEFVLKAPGFIDETIRYVIPDQAFVLKPITLKMDKPPIIGKPWWDSLDQQYEAVGNMHESELIEASNWERYVEFSFYRKEPIIVEIDHRGQSRAIEKIVLAKENDFNEFADWLTTEAQEAGRLLKDQEVVAVIKRGFKGKNYTPQHALKEMFPAKLRVQKIPFATLELEVEPTGSKIYLGDDFIGTTKIKDTGIRPGTYLLRIESDGYESLEKEVTLSQGQSLKIPRVVLQKNDSLIKGKAWTNKLGMPFVPLNETLMASAWETRVKDYQVYLTAIGEEMPNAEVNRKPNEPVVYVSFRDASEFAKWLTERDLKEGSIPEGSAYRIPTDHEWSMMVGLEEDEATIIPKKALENQGQYPWSGGWDPVRGDKLKALVDRALPIGNFSDETRRKWNKLTRNYYKGYTDGHSGTSPVGAFKANQRGIFDLAGNVSEWVAENVQGGEVEGGRFQVYRGSSFRTYVNKGLISSFRGYTKVGGRDVAIGFRLVLKLPEVLDGE